LDLVVDGKVVGEAKTVDRLKDRHIAQVKRYLRFSGIEVVASELLGLAAEGGTEAGRPNQALLFFFAPPRLRVLAFRPFLCCCQEVGPLTSASRSSNKKLNNEDAEARGRGESKGIGRYETLASAYRIG
jgi:hypothetical protein